MIARIKLVFRYLKYLFQSQNASNIHSPFVFELVENVIYNQHPYYAFKTLEAWRQNLQLNAEVLDVEDLGAGSSYGSKRKRKAGSICRQSVKRSKYAQLLFRLVQQTNPRCIVELGTSLGLTTLYLSIAGSKAKVITIEGAPSLANFAQKGFEKFKRKNITQLIGSFDEQIPTILSEPHVSDFVFIDGHHEKEATLRYFNMFAEKVHNSSIFIMDDIHWSDGMEAAWNEIKSHEKVSMTIDLFEMGLVFFEKRFQKEHFVIRF